MAQKWVKIGFGFIFMGSVPGVPGKRDRKARKRNPNLNFLVRMFSGGVGVFHVKGWGPKKFGLSLKTRETKLFWRDLPGCCRDIPEVPKKFEIKKVCVQFCARKYVVGGLFSGICKRGRQKGVSLICYLF